ncbi:zinc-binding dehydrogenase [Mycobacterium sp. NPDC003449]
MTAISTDKHGAPTMRALRQRSAAGPGDLAAVTDQPTPTPGPGEVLVKVDAAGVNFADVMHTYGTYVGGPRAPYVAGFEMAGEVLELGPGVTRPRVGDRIVAWSAGAYAEYALAPAAAVLPVPSGWTSTEAIGLEANWFTALAALRLRGVLGDQHTVLIHAAAGGVGQAAVRLARHYGARVLGTASPGKRDLLRSLGVDDVIDYGSVTEQVLALTAGEGVDLVLDSVGATTLEASLAVARPVTGSVVVYGVAAGDASVAASDLIFRHQVNLVGLHIGVLARRAPGLHAELLEELDGLIRAAVIAPGRPEVHRLEDGRTVLRLVESRGSVGKHVLIP